VNPLFAPIELPLRLINRITEELRGAGDAAADLRGQFETLGDTIAARAEVRAQQVAAVPGQVASTADGIGSVIELMTQALPLLRSLDDKAGRILDLAEDLNDRADKILALGGTVSGQAETIIGLGGTVSGQAETIIDLGGRVSDLGEQMVSEAATVSARAAAINETALKLLPTAEQALSIVGPLEGAVERLGRVVDRLPGQGRVR